MKKSLFLIGLTLAMICKEVACQDFIFTFEGYRSGDTAFLQFGPEYRSPRYHIIISDGDVVYKNDAIGDVLLAKIYLKGNYGSPFVMERGRVHKVKNGSVRGSIDNDSFSLIYDSLWGGKAFAGIMEASNLRDSAKTEQDKKHFYDLLIERHIAREKKVKHFLETDTLGVGLYIAYVLRTTATPGEMKIWLDNHKRFVADEHYKRIESIYIPQSKTDLGMRLPDFEAIDINGNMFSLNQFLKNFKGEAIILDFWASWCHACRAKVPHLKEIYSKFKDSGLEIIGISSDKTVEPWIKAMEKDGSGIWVNVIDKENKTGKQFGIPGIPKSFVLDKKGVIHYFGAGGLADETETVKKLLKIN